MTSSTALPYTVREPSVTFKQRLFLSDHDTIQGARSLIVEATNDLAGHVFQEWIHNQDNYHVDIEVRVYTPRDGIPVAHNREDR